MPTMHGKLSPARSTSSSRVDRLKNHAVMNGALSSQLQGAMRAPTGNIAVEGGGPIESLLQPSRSSSSSGVRPNSRSGTQAPACAPPSSRGVEGEGARVVVVLCFASE